MIHQATSLGGQARHRAGGQAHNPCFALDGDTIAFQSNHEGETGIFAARIDGSNLRRLTPAGLAAQRPAWFPDGHRLAFSARRRHDWEIFAASFAGPASSHTA